MTAPIDTTDALRVLLGSLLNDLDAARADRDMWKARIDRLESALLAIDGGSYCDTCQARLAAYGEKSALYCKGCSHEDHRLMDRDADDLNAILDELAGAQ